ncbi:MAG: ferric reductase-like transmembrane domain-containing protein [Deltaproteobacteria bacterium]|nr:ferric reductase-like transmembrane domain-containing protein [Deltaproteobacteria bacterium]
MLSTRSLRKLTLIPCLGPGIELGVRAIADGFSPNPIADILNILGWWTLVLLLVTLVCTPLKLVFGWSWPPRLRKMLGLAAFFWGLVHFGFYYAIDQGLDFSVILDDLKSRKFIIVGFASLLLMLPLALTSRSSTIRKMGPERWNRLHLLVYPAAILGVLHFVWRVKSDYREPIIFTLSLFVLLGIRLLYRLRPKAKTAT